MNRLLVLAGGREAQFLEHPVARRHLWIVNFLGTAMSVAIACIQLSTSSLSNRSPNIVSAVSLLLSSAHMCWMLAHPSSYLCHQWYLQMIHRVGWLGIAYFLANQPRGELVQSLKGTSQLEPGSWRAYQHVMLLVPFHILTNAVNHPVPFRHMLLLAIPVMGISVVCGLPTTWQRSRSISCSSSHCNRAERSTECLSRC